MLHSGQKRSDWKPIYTGNPDALCSTRKNRNWCKRKGSYRKAQCCFFVCTIFDSFLNDLYLHPTILPSYFPPTKKSARRHYGDERRSCSVQTTLNIFLLGFSIFFSPPDIFNCLSRLLLLFSNKNWFPWNIHTTFQGSLYFSLRWHPLWCADLFAVYESYYYTISISRSWLSRFL